MVLQKENDHACFEQMLSRVELISQKIICENQNEPYFKLISKSF